MKKLVIGTVAGFVLGWASLTGVALAITPSSGPDATAEFYGGEYAVDEVSMLQADFPCEEDEALMYHPSFGPDNVGCINLELV